ncbi:hypothetical protein [Legionella norrlandica]|uniref:hypothetical protein n=1 Tax=Legionella norrlandica TaxID=1498499 RepID=UPI000A41F635|nr:hypothetical protein [Legionella norrlandica]
MWQGSSGVLFNRSVKAIHFFKKEICGCFRNGLIYRIDQNNACISDRMLEIILVACHC